MGLKKGQVPKPYEDGMLINMRDRTPEERHEIAMKGVEARRKRKSVTWLYKTVCGSYWK